MSNDDLIKELMNNGKPTKYFVVRMYVEFTQHFTKLNGKVGFHDKFIWIFIGILITGLIGGAIAYFIF
ncbi:hypothetical protein ES707_14567 [subsurface metagenome]